MRLNHRSRPLRFLAAVLGGWVAFRTTILLWPIADGPWRAPPPDAPRTTRPETRRPIAGPVAQLAQGLSGGAPSGPAGAASERDIARDAATATPRAPGAFAARTAGPDLRLAHPRPVEPRDNAVATQGTRVTRAENGRRPRPGTKPAGPDARSTFVGEPLPAAPPAIDRPPRAPDVASLPTVHRPGEAPPSPPPAADRKPSPEPAGLAIVTPPPRLEGWAYAFVRPGGGPRGLAGVGQIGGSQAAARIAWRLSPAAMPRIAVAVRVASAIGEAGREAAPGIEIGGSRLRLTVERRIGIDRAGRDAWAAFASGGAYRAAGGWVAEGYAQAGVVGARRRDLFADGAVRGGRRMGAAIVGAGLWGAAQPGAARIDAGPRLALRLPGTAILIAAEQRFRLTGRARPGSGPAVTIASDF